MTATVDENELMHLNVGDFVAVLTHHMGDGKVHWTLGSVETPPYMRDVEIRLWERQRNEYYNEGDMASNPETEALMKRIGEVKGDLQRSIDQADALTQDLRARRAEIMQQIGEADDYVAESKAVMHAARDDVESISDRHWQELKSYRIPPKMVSVIIRAVMLLLSEDEARTWPQMQRVLRDFNFKRRITGYDPEVQLSPERREYILQECVSKKSFRYDRAMQGSVAVGPIYYWVLAQLDCGEAQSQKNRVDAERVERQKELRDVLKQIAEQQQRIAEYQELMDDLDDQLRMCSQHAEGSASRARDSAGPGGRQNSGLDRYNNSWAAREGKDYLRPAFYTWKPTDRVIIVLRKNIVCDFGDVAEAQKADGYDLSDPQVHNLDDALMRRQRQLDSMDDAQRMREDRDLENDMLRQDDTTPKERVPLASVQLQRKFEGKNWQRVLDRKREAISVTFKEESAECLDVPEYYISIDDLTVGSLIVDFTAQHESGRSDAQMQQAVNSFGYPRTMALYEESDEEGPEHQMKFGGDRWVDIVPEHRAEVDKAFLKDTSAATGVRARDVQILDVRADEAEGLTVDYSMADKSLSAEQVQTKVDEYQYPEVWALYQRLSGLEEAPSTHQVHFKGNRWADIAPGHEDEIREAFTTDSCNALNVEPEQVGVGEMRYDGGLTVPYTVSNSPLDEDQVDQQAAEYKYPETWALYDRLVAEAAGADYQKGFDGEHWEMVLNAARPELKDAFVEDTSNAVPAEPAAVDPRSMDTDQQRLLVSYNVDDTEDKMEEVRENTKEYPYPEVWGLYQQVVDEEAKGTKNLERRFEGDRWQEICEAKPAAVREAFTDDAIAATGVKPKAVKIQAVKPDKKGMTVKYGVDRDKKTSAHQVIKGMDESEYPATWSLYEQEKSSGNNLNSLPPRVFVGEEWHNVLDEKRPALERAFKEDAAEALEVAPQDVKVRSISADDEQLVVDYAVQRCPSNAKEATNKSEDYAYPNVWALYPDEEELGKHARAFEGAGWENVVANREDDLRDAFKNDVSNSVGAHPDDVEVKSMRANPDGVVVRYDVHNVQCPDEEINDISEQYEYPQVWALYEEEGEKDWVTTSHQVGFDGEDWGYVVDNRHEELEEAFEGCTAEVFNLRRGNVTNAKYSVGSLIVDFDLTHPPQLTENEINKQLNACPYEPVWDLYGTRPYDEREIIQTDHEIGFEGEGWEHVLQTDRAEVEKAFKKDTAIALDVDDEDVRVEDMSYADESLIVRANVQHHVFQDEDLIQEQLTRYPYDNVWELYSEDPDADWMTTSHQVGFEGDDWQYVLDNKKLELVKAFRDCTGEELDVQDDHITNLTMKVEESLLCDFELKHPRAMPEDEVNRILTSCDYRPVWDLYLEHRYDPSEVVKTTHEIGFEGEEWDKVMEHTPEQLEEAVKRDTAEALEVEPSDVTNVRTRLDGDTMIVKMDVVHNVLQDSDLIQEQLSRYPYERVWALYEDAPLTPDERGLGAGGPGESGIVERRFDGEDWDVILEESPEELNTAFKKDAARALGVPQSNVRVISSEVGSLIVKYQVIDPPMDDDAIRQTVDDDECPEVMGLYRRRLRSGADEEGEVNKGRALPPAAASDEGAHAKEFPGVNWEECAREEEPVVKAFQKDTADALGVAPEEVQVRSVKPDEEKLRVTYDAPVAASEAEAKADAHAYPEVWALYQDDMVTTAHALSFEAPEWDYVVRRRRWELARAISDDSADATGLEADAMVDVKMAATPTNLPATVYIRHRRDLSVEEIDELLNVAPFERVWALYELLAPSAELTKTFRGEGWAGVKEQREGDLQRAFAEDTAKSLNVSRLEVEVRDMEATDKDLNVTYVVRGCSMQDEEMKEAADNYPYPQVWALYDAEGQVTGQRNFEGDAWEEVLRKKRPQAEEAFRADTAAALGVDVDDVDVNQATADHKGLHVQYAARISDGAAAAAGANNDADAAAEKAEAAKNVRAYDYPRLWNLYGETAKDDDDAAAMRGMGERESGELQRTFPGDDWDLVLDDVPEEADDCFKKGVSDSLGISKSQVVMLDSRLGSLIMDYKVRGCDMEDDEIDAKVQEHDFPELMALYRARMRGGEDGDALPAGYTRTPHQVGFDGEDWSYAVNTNGDGVREAFIQDSAAELGCRPEDIRDVRIDVEKQMLVDFVVQHPEEQSEGDVDAQLKSCPYERVWELYGTHPYDPNDNVTTEHDVGFEGEDWDYVVEKKRAELEQTFKRSTGNAVEVPASDVKNLKIEKAEDGIVITCNITHNRLQDREMMQEELQRYPYEEMWALYETRPYDSSNKVATVHELAFEGEGWAVVCEMQGEELRRAVIEDTAAAINVDQEDVVEVRNVANDDGLSVRVKVMHSPLQDNDMIQEMLSSYEYEHVWALYEGAVESEVMTKTFPGERWPAVLEARKDGVSNAFLIDSSNMLNLPPRFVSVKETTADKEGLTVQYTLMGDWFSEEEVTKRSGAYEYPEVWALYNGPKEEKRDLPYAKTFPGTNWQPVVENHKEELTRAVQEDTAAAMGDGVKPEDIEVTNIEANEEELRVNVRAPTAAGQQRAEKEKLAEHPYPAVWELYQGEEEDDDAAAMRGLGDRESGEMQRTFPGDDWDIVVDDCPEEAEDCFKKGVADSLGVSKSQVVVLDSRLGSLIMDYKVRGCDMEDDEIDAKVQEHDFPELMALYRARMRGGDEGEGGAAAAAAAAAEEEEMIETHQNVGFEGEDWDYTWGRKEEKIRAAFITGTAKALDIPEDHIRDLNFEKSDDGMVLYAEITHNAAHSAEEVHDRLQDAEYAELWPLYETRPYDPNDVVESNHTIMFQGEHWDYVRAHKEAEVEQAIRDDAAAAAEVEPEQVHEVATTVDHAGLLAKVTVEHPRLQDDEVVQEQLTKCEYPRVWALYCPEEEAPRGSKHFEGDAWPEVLEDREDAVEAAFKVDTANAMKAKPDDVQVRDMKASEKGMDVDYTVHFCATPEPETKRTLETYPYPNVWDQYRTAEDAKEQSRQVVPVEAIDDTEAVPVGMARTNLSVSFDGDLWAVVVRNRAQELADAFRSGTAKAVSLPESEIRIREYLVGSLLVHFVVQHPATTTEASLRADIDEYPYEEVWALYDEEEAAAAGVWSNVLTKRFDGVDWDVVLRDKRPQLTEAFKEDTADVLQTAPTQVEVEGMALGSLIVKYRVANLAIPAEKATNLTDNYAYPKVWALYRGGDENSVSRVSRASAGRASRKSAAARPSRRTEPLTVEEGVESEDSVTYLRRALTDARRERDQYMEEAEEAKRASEIRK